MPGKIKNFMTTLKDHEFKAPSRTSCIVKLRDIVPEGCMGMLPLTKKELNALDYSDHSTATETTDTVPNLLGGRRASLGGSCTDLDLGDFHNMDLMDLQPDAKLLQELNPMKPQRKNSGNRRVKMVRDISTESDDTATTTGSSGREEFSLDRCGSGRALPKRSSSNDLSASSSCPGEKSLRRSRRNGSDKDLNDKSRRSTGGRRVGSNRSLMDGSTDGSTHGGMRRSHRSGSDKDLKSLMKANRSNRRSDKDLMSMSGHHHQRDEAGPRKGRRPGSTNDMRSILQRDAPSTRGMTRTKSYDGGPSVNHRTGLSEMRESRSTESRRNLGRTNSMGHGLKSTTEKAKERSLVTKKAALELLLRVEREEDDSLSRSERENQGLRMARLSAGTSRLSSDLIRESLRQAAQAKAVAEQQEAENQEGDEDTPDLAPLSRSSSAASSSDLLKTLYQGEEARQEAETKAPVPAALSGAPGFIQVPVHEGQMILPPVAPYIWTCTCGSDLSLCMKFCGKCATPRHWECEGCQFGFNPCDFSFCGKCGHGKE